MMRFFSILLSCFCVAQAETVLCLGGKTTHGQHIAYAENNAWPVILGRLLGDKYSVSNSGKESCYH
jgi:hypothetical protein